MDEQLVCNELGHWTARAADSYQELARLFSSYLSCL